jgi:UDP-N-acetyl-D-mannosaminuronate dehydrogenase
VILTDHAEYDWELILREAKVIVDARNATSAARAKEPTLAAKVWRI